MVSVSVCHAIAIHKSNNVVSISRIRQNFVFGCYYHFGACCKNPHYSKVTLSVVNYMQHKKSVGIVSALIRTHGGILSACVMTNSSSVFGSFEFEISKFIIGNILLYFLWYLRWCRKHPIGITKNTNVLNEHELGKWKKNGLFVHIPWYHGR